jgi:hypothetical protein
MDHVQVHVVLVIDAGSVRDYTHDMVKEVSKVEESFVLHVDHVPEHVGTHIAEKNGLVEGILLSALDLSDEQYPITGCQEGAKAVVKTDKSVSYNHAIIWFLELFSEPCRERVIIRDNEEEDDLEDVHDDEPLPDCLRIFLVIGKIPPTRKESCSCWCCFTHKIYYKFL